MSFTMFNCATRSFIERNVFFQTAHKQSTLKRFLQSSDTWGKRYMSRIKFRPHIENTSFQSGFRCKNAPQKPVVLISGILTYLGLKEKTPEEKEEELILAIKNGILLMQMKKYKEADLALHVALETAQQRNDEDAVTYIYDILGNVAFEAGEHKKAEKLFVTVLQRILGKGEPEDSNKVIHISLKLAKIFQDTKQYKKADQGFNFCIDSLEKKLQEADEDTLALWGMSMDWYARFLLDNNRKNEALNCFRKAYDMCVKVNGLVHEQTVVLLNDLGTVSSLIGDTESAVDYFEKAKDIGNKLPEMQDLATIYINLGQLYFLKEMYNESKKACEEGLKKAKSFDNTVATSEAEQCLDNIKKVFLDTKGTNDLKLNSLTKTQGLKSAQLAS